ncbi:MAG: hypothetical protein JNM57_14070 [Cyclobacteriaceae bacterium]|nr:hypothetical protein [Cyclobacteriaceae bacterium]
METTKVSRKTRIPSLFFGVVSMITLATSCDVLEADEDLKVPDAKVSNLQVFVQGNNTAIIDLKAQVQANQPVTLSVTSSTQKGTLTNLGGGLLQYTSAGSANSDSFEFSVYSASNQLITKDTVVITIESDSTNLPCGIYPNDDIIFGISPGVSTTINVLDNDLVCGYTIAELEVSIYAPEDKFPPYAGSAQVSGSAILYTAGSSFSGVDKVVYRVSPKNDPSIASYGLVYLTGEQACSFTLTNDLKVSSEEFTQIRIPVLGNDQLCQSINSFRVTIAQNPTNGTAYIESDTLVYQPYVLATDGFSDSLIYKVCIDGTCKTASVTVRVDSNNGDVCTLRAFADSVDISALTASVIYLNVLTNDELCDTSVNLSLSLDPKYGTATVVTENGKKLIAYTPDYNQVVNDKLEYKITRNNSSSTTSVDIKRVP